jgi:hypothetical protein
MRRARLALGVMLVLGLCLPLAVACGSAKPSASSPTKTSIPAPTRSEVLAQVTDFAQRSVPGGYKVGRITEISLKQSGSGNWTVRAHVYPAPSCTYGPGRMTMIWNGKSWPSFEFDADSHQPASGSPVALP